MTSTKRFKLTIEYDGTNFAGWQRQDNAPSIQETLEDAITAFTGEPTILFIAGRTDAGVHAKGQVAHVDLPERFDADTVRRAINAHVRPHPIVILKSEIVASDFHARFDAVKRHYMYNIINRPSPLTFDKHRAWHIKYPLNVELMEEAAQHLVGCHDFSTFRTVHCQAKSPVRTIDKIHIKQSGSSVSCFLTAPSFLHHQVRNIVGTLALVGSGKWKPQDVLTALEARDRRAGGPTAPSDGLYFMQVDYNTNHHL